MTAFFSLAFSWRSMFALWTFLLCFAGIAGICLSFIVGRSRYAVLSAASAVPSYFLWQVIFNLYRFGQTELAAPVSVGLGSLPWLAWLAALLPVTYAAVLSLYLSIRRGRTCITPLAIKRCADRMPCGICYWLESGRVIFSNTSMDSLCLALTGERLMNGNGFRDAAAGGVRRVGDAVWDFTCRDMMYNGGLLHEMVARDVTELHQKTEALQRENAGVARMNEQLKAYSLKIDETVRRQEILQAKVNIHDEMNRLMLSTVAADCGDKEEMDRIFTLWERSAMLLCLEAEEKRDGDAVSRLENLAAALGVRLVWSAAMPESLTKRQRELVFTAAREAVVNAVKHAEAKTVAVSFKESAGAVCCRFANDGRLPAGKVRFAGGLANLQLLAAEQNAAISVKTEEKFELLLHFCKK